MASPFDFAWSFLKAEKYRGSEHRRRYDYEHVDNKYDNEAHAWADEHLPKVRGPTNEHRQRVEGGDVTTQDKSHLFIPKEKRKILQTFPPSDNTHDAYSQDDIIIDTEDEDNQVEHFTPEEIYEMFSQNRENEGYKENYYGI